MEKTSSPKRTMRPAPMILLSAVLLGAIALYARNSANREAVEYRNQQVEQAAALQPRFARMSDALVGGQKTMHVWRTVSDSEQGITFRYPERFPARFIGPLEWPPRVRVTSGCFSCKEGEFLKNDLTYLRERRKVNNRDYCVEKRNGVGLGKRREEYSYVTLADNKLITLKFTLRSNSCGNFDEPRKSQCTRERKAFDPDSLVDRIVRSVQYK